MRLPYGRSFGHARDESFVNPEPMITSTSISSLIRGVAGLAFACGVMGLLILQTITLVPGTGGHWLFMGCGLLLLSGLLLREWHYRSASVVLAVWCTVAGFQNHAQGIAYKERMMSKKAAHTQPS
jgi:hypothetical protein